MTRALIGQTGFVGKNLLEQQHFDIGFSSRNISDIRYHAFDSIICAGVSAVKWWANNNADLDLANIEMLISHLEHVDAKNFILISTIDVYADPRSVDETDVPSKSNLHPYGRNRLYFEEFIRSKFPYAQIVRLPALFGNYLKKNAIYDLITRNQTNLINPAASFQWYPVKRLTSDLCSIEDSGFEIVHLACEPLLMGDICARYFPDVVVGDERYPAPVYDFRTIHANIFGETGPYMVRQPAIWYELGQFVSAAMIG